jgi:hypothetical protein
VKEIVMATYNVKAHPEFAGYDLREASGVSNKILFLWKKDVLIAKQFSSLAS